jgi:hypothetical protein
MSLVEFNQWVGYLTIAAAVGFLGRLLWFGLAPRFCWLFGYFLADVLQGALVIGVPPRSLWYGYVYFIGQAAKAMLAVGLSVQLWLLALRGYPALARFGRRIAIYMLLGALLLAAAGLLLEPPRPTFQSSILHYFNGFEGALDSMVGLFLVAATLFLLWFPVVVPRNVAVIMGGFVVFLFQHWAELLLVNLHPQSTYGINAISLAAVVAVLIFWIIAVRPNGENLTTVTGHRWNPQEVERLLSQLDTINTRLEQSIR